MFSGNDLAEGLAAVIIGAFVVGALSATTLILGVPALWSWLKPIIHSLTA